MNGETDRTGQAKMKVKILDQGNVNCAEGHAMATAVQGAYRVNRIKYPAPKNIYVRASARAKLPAQESDKK